MGYRIAFTHGDILDEEGNVVLEGVEVNSTVVMDLEPRHEEKFDLHEGFYCDKCNKVIEPPPGLDPCSVVSVPCTTPDCNERAIVFSKVCAAR